MSTAFHCVEHVVSCQHTREYPNATESEEGALSLAVKQYIPHDNRSPQAGDVTVLAAHANGLPKVSSNEFLLKQEGLKGGKGNIRAKEIYSRWKASGIRIRGIWIADAANQGQSGLINESILGNDRESRFIQFNLVKTWF